MWARYNRRRAKNRAADNERRRANAAAKLAAHIDAFTPGAAPKISRKRHGFRITVECLDDGAKSSFVALRTPFGLTVSPSSAGKRVACVLRNYLPA